MKLTTIRHFILLVGAMIAAAAVFGQRKPASTGREEYIEVEKNVKLHVTDWGEGKPVVLIHGWPLSDAMYEYQYQDLFQKGFRVIGITMRGFGLSDKPFGTYNYDVYADDIKVVLDKLKIENATIGGFSMGGGIVTRYVSRHKAAHVSRMALFGGASPKWTQAEDYPYGLKKEEVDGMIAISRIDRAKLYEVFGSIFGATPTSISTGLAAWLGNINWQASAYAATQSLIALRDEDMRKDAASITIPVLILHGTNDKIVPLAIAEQANKAFKNSSLIKFDKSGHALFIEEREKFNSELIKFAGQ
jgi:non-heme chloroperoxidase